jgi:hypothetical protein
LNASNLQLSIWRRVLARELFHCVVYISLYKGDFSVAGERYRREQRVYKNQLNKIERGIKRGGQELEQRIFGRYKCVVGVHNISGANRRSSNSRHVYSSADLKMLMVTVFHMQMSAVRF